MPSIGLALSAGGDFIHTLRRRTLIGWSVITPDQGTVYECRWTND